MGTLRRAGAKPHARLSTQAGPPLSAGKGAPSAGIVIMADCRGGPAGDPAAASQASAGTQVRPAPCLARAPRCADGVLRRRDCPRRLTKATGRPGPSHGHQAQPLTGGETRVQQAAAGGDAQAADQRSLLTLLGSSMRHLSTRLLAGAGFDQPGAPDAPAAAAPPAHAAAVEAAGVEGLPHEGPQGLGALPLQLELAAGHAHAGAGASPERIKAHHGMHAGVGGAALDLQARPSLPKQALKAQG